MRISPEVIDSRPAIVLSSVDLPHPDGPTRTRKPPCSSEMSMPLRISSEPNFLRRERISSVDIRLSFHSASHKAADEITSCEDVDDEGGSSGDHRRGHVRVVFNDAGRGVDDVVQRYCHRGCVAGGEGRPKQEVIPD